MRIQVVGLFVEEIHFELVDNVLEAEDFIGLRKEVGFTVHFTKRILIL